MCRECCCNSIYNEQDCYSRRRFLSKAERVEKLKEFSEELKKELIAIEENIKELDN